VRRRAMIANMAIESAIRKETEYALAL